MSTNLRNIPSLNTELSKGDGVIVGVVVEYNKSSVWTKTLSLLRNSPVCPSLFPTSWLLFTPLLFLATAFLFFALYLKQKAKLVTHTASKSCCLDILNRTCYKHLICTVTASRGPSYKTSCTILVSTITPPKVRSQLLHSTGHTNLWTKTPYCPQNDFWVLERIWERFNNFLFTRSQSMWGFPL